LQQPVSLKDIKANPKLQEMPLVRMGRLSVMLVAEAEFREILQMGETVIEQPPSL
jgi:predicted RNA-binding protein with PUA-like domain